MKKIIISILLLSSLVYAGLVNDGLNALKHENYKEAAKLWRKAANQGNAVAQYDLGLMYDYGKGVKQNYFKAVKWYRKATNQGAARAQYNLGNMYNYGKGVKQNYVKAVKWYRKAAVARAQYNLSLMYGLGHGVKQNFVKAKELLGKACDGGYEPGCKGYKLLNERGIQ